jgi:ribosomal protein S18 acetylase RimI-like enzyme
MRNLFCRFIPRQETYLLLAKDLQRAASPSPQPADPLETSLLTTPDDPLAQSLDQFCTTHGFPPAWPLGMLRQSAQALVATDPATHTIIGMAWLTTRPFYVEEIDHTLDPAGGVYLFGDFVAPAHRGKRLHRALIEQRLAHTNAPFACTIIRDNNTPSINNYRALNFIPTTRLTRRRWFGRTDSNCTPVNADHRHPVFERQPGNRLVARPYAASSST